MATKTKILLAEDDKNLGSVLKAYLEAKGFNTTLCIDGKEALEAFKRGEFDFCIFDIMMPVMDGIVATKKIREIESTGNRHVPIIAITAYALAGDRDNCLSAGVDDYIAKPFQANVLIKMMKNLLA